MTENLPGRLIDPATSLHAWNDWLVLPGHQDKDQARVAILRRYPAIDTDMELGPAFHERVRPDGAWGWEMGGPIPVTLFAPQRRDDEEEPDRDGAELSRFYATPAEVDAFLREHFAEDTLLRYQQAIGGRAAEEAAKDIRCAIAVRSLDPTRQALSAKEAADHIDPIRGGGHWPSSLITFGAKEQP